MLFSEFIDKLKRGNDNKRNEERREEREEEKEEEKGERKQTTQAYLGGFGSRQPQQLKQQKQQKQQQHYTQRLSFTSCDEVYPYNSFFRFFFSFFFFFLSISCSYYEGEGVLSPAGGETVDVTTHCVLVQSAHEFRIWSGLETKAEKRIRVYGDLPEK